MSSPETAAILTALAKVICCPYGKCQESRVQAHGGCRSDFYRVSAQMKIDGLARMGIALQRLEPTSRGIA